MADALVLGASTYGVWVQVTSPAPNKKDAMWRLFYLVPRGAESLCKGLVCALMKRERQP